MDAEVPGELEKALGAYRDVEVSLAALAVEHDAEGRSEQQRVLTYCLLRQGNALRHLGRSAEAAAIGERELEVARTSGNDIALARSIMSAGANLIGGGQPERGLQHLQEGRSLFESDTTYDHRQGLGWHWILKADMMNAGLVPGDPAAVMEAANRALKILTPLENWPGTARAYCARAQAHESLGHLEEADADREEQHLHESRTEPVSGSAG